MLMAATYKIKDGDTIQTVAKQLGVDSNQLASANNLSAISALTTGAELNVPQIQTPAAATQPTASPYAGLSGLSQTTAQKVGDYGQGYQQSSAVTAAQNYLNGVLGSKPGEYTSQYQQGLNDLYDRIMNREKFTYDLNADMLYQQYRDQYQRLGQNAMMDTMAQASALTGGYGNSYASTAGNQAYQAYLQQLNDIVPELYAQARDAYNDEGNELLNRFNVTANLENDAYGKYRDTVADWNTERDFANADYWNKYNADYSDFQTMMNYWNTMAQQENAQWADGRDLAYSQAMTMLQSGLMPSEDLLASAGISAYDAQQIYGLYKPSSSGGGSRRYSGGGSGSGDAATDSKTNTSVSSDSGSGAGAGSGATSGNGLSTMVTANTIAALLKNVRTAK